MPDQNIVGIFDLENTSQSRITRDYLAKSEKKGQIVTVADDIPRTFIVCCDKKDRYTIYLSQMSSANLYKRLRENTEIKRIEFEERKYGRNYRTY